MDDDGLTRAERRHRYTRLTDLFAAILLVLFIVSATAAGVALYAAHQASTVADTAKRNSAIARQNSERLDGEAYARCSSSRRLTPVFNQRILRPLRGFLRDAAEARRQAAADPNASRRVRRQNLVTARKYETRARMAKDFKAPKCRKPDALVKREKAARLRRP